MVESAAGEASPALPIVAVPEPNTIEEKWDVPRNYRRIWHEENRILARKLFREITDNQTEQDLAQQRKEHQEMMAERKKAKGKKQYSARLLQLSNKT